MVNGNAFEPDVAKSGGRRRSRCNPSITDTTLDGELEFLRAFLVQAVGCVFEVDAAHLLAPTRGCAANARARQVLMYLAHVACGLTLTDVGCLFDRDRTTVAHACRVVEDGREDEEFDSAVEIVERLVVLVTSTTRERWLV